eukprot:199396-Chlamydomonas_euryale.AAC.3
MSGDKVSGTMMLIRMPRQMKWPNQSVAVGRRGRPADFGMYRTRRIQSLKPSLEAFFFSH